MVDFAKLKSMRGGKSLEALSKELEKISGQDGGGKKGDDRFWSPTVDKAGNGYAVIRFLPAPKDEEVPFIRIFDHGFQGPTGLWYIENSLTTIGKSDPVTEFNSKLWNTNKSDDSPERKQARKQKRRLHYVSNIYVEQDSGNPDNEGKVFLYKYGKKIFDKLNEAMNPQFADEQAFNPFDLWEGASFKLKIRNVEGYRNYDKSEFSKPAPLFDDDKKLEEVYNKEYSIQEFLDPKNFKSYDDLKNRLMKVLDESSPTVGKAESENLEQPKASAARAPKAQRAVEPEDDPPFDVSTDEETDSLEFFKKLASK